MVLQTSISALEIVAADRKMFKDIYAKSSDPRIGAIFDQGVMFCVVLV